MHAVRSTLLIIAAGFVASLVSGPALAAGDSPAAVSGRVTTWVGGGPLTAPTQVGLPGARIIIGKDIWLDTNSAFTDVVKGERIVVETDATGDGKFSVDVAPGTYTIIVWKQGYVPVSDVLVSPGEFPTSLSKNAIEAGGKHTNLDRQVKHTGPEAGAEGGAAAESDVQGLSGTVSEWVGGAPGVEPKQQPLSGATIIVGRGLWLDTNDAFRDVVKGEAILAEASSSEGKFRVVLNPGIYDVIVWKKGYVPVSDKVSVPGAFATSLSTNAIEAGGKHSFLDREAKKEGADTPAETPPGDIVVPDEALKGAIDVVLIIDSTGSMSDDIDAVRKTIYEFLDKLAELSPSWRVAVVTYKDYSDAPAASGISGRLTEWVGAGPLSTPSEKPLAGVKIVVGEGTWLDGGAFTDTVKGEKVVATTTTGPDGLYAVSVPGGTYNVVAWKQRYTPSTNNVTSPGIWNSSLSKKAIEAGGMHTNLAYEVNSGPPAVKPDEPGASRIPGYMTLLPFTSDVAAIKTFIDGIQVGGGGDTPEALLDALMLGIAQPWRDGVSKQLLPMTDAPPHPKTADGKDAKAVAAAAEAVDPAQIYPILVGNSGSYDSEAREALENLAKLTKGKVFEASQATEVPAAMLGAVTVATRGTPPPTSDILPSGSVPVIESPNSGDEVAGNITVSGRAAPGDLVVLYTLVFREDTGQQVRKVPGHRHVVAEDGKFSLLIATPRIAFGPDVELRYEIHAYSITPERVQSEEALVNTKQRAR